MVSANDNVHEDAALHVAHLASQVGFPAATPVVVAAAPTPGRPHLDARRLHLTRRHLRTDISTYGGRLKAPTFTAGAVHAIAGSGAIFHVDLTAHATVEQIVLAQHLRALHNEWKIRSAGVAEAATVTAAAQHLWHPDHYSGDAVTALALLELLPRADCTLLPVSAVTSVRAAAADRLGAQRYVEFLHLWRAALTGRPTKTSRPSLLDWLALADTWLALMRSHLPAVSVTVAQTADDQVRAWTLLTTNPCGDPVGRAGQAELAAAAHTAVQRCAQLADQRDAHDDNLRPLQRQAKGSRDSTGGAGGATVSGQRTLLWRSATPDDDRNRRQFAHALSTAGHRGPRIAPTPVTYPTGRPNTRQLAIRQAQIAAGRIPTATPWTALRTQPRLSEQLLLAMVIDTSATMAAWTGATLPLGWAAAHAVADLGGICAVWGFAGEAFPIIGGGRAPQMVPQLHDPGSGSFGSIAAMQEATAPLQRRRGCPVLVVVTDGKLPGGDEVRAAVADYVADGVEVVWVMPRTTTGPDVIRPAAATIVDDYTPTTVAAGISAAILNRIRNH